jgi:hypothetical protein
MGRRHLTASPPCGLPSAVCLRFAPAPTSKLGKVGSIWPESWTCIHAKWRAGTPPTHWPRSL